jgi:hypothetical protein
MLKTDFFKSEALPGQVLFFRQKVGNWEWVSRLIYFFQNGLLKFGPVHFNLAFSKYMF